MCTFTKARMATIWIVLLLGVAPRGAEAAEGPVLMALKGAAAKCKPGPCTAAEAALISKFATLANIECESTSSSMTEEAACKRAVAAAAGSLSGASWPQLAAALACGRACPAGGCPSPAKAGACKEARFLAQAECRARKLKDPSGAASCEAQLARVPPAFFVAAPTPARSALGAALLKPTDTAEIHRLLAGALMECAKTWDKPDDDVHLWRCKSEVADALVDGISGGDPSPPSARTAR